MGEIRVVKVTSNDSTELIYLPKTIREKLNLRKGTYVKLMVDGKRLIIEPLQL
jgi:AbrB family looped-hinge helix DNA binding protein